MPALAYIVCESRPHGQPWPTEGTDWQAEARFLVAQPRDFAALLHAAGLADLGHPEVLSIPVSADLLFEDGEIEGQTHLSLPQTARLLGHAGPDMRVRLAAWLAFAHSLEQSGQDTRLIVWFIR